jgi:folate-dependent phosphoribosylglycinamide formyltransferase PurN
MNITLITSDQIRHNYLVNLLSNIATKLNVIQEKKTFFSNQNKISNLMKNYFLKVDDAQKKVFGNTAIDKKNKNIKLLSLENKELEKCSLNSLSDFLNSDIFIVFGSSFIKKDLVNFLIDHKALNIHLGISPYYRGTDCNFWALFDNNPHLVGATIHLLSKGLDSGPILYHALSEIKEDPFIYTMSAVKSAFESIAQKIENKTIFEHTPEIQDKSKEIKYSKKNEFNDEVIKKFFLNKIDLNSKIFKLDLYKNPYFLKNLKKF